MKNFLKGLGYFFVFILLIGACGAIFSEDDASAPATTETKAAEPKAEEPKEEPKAEEPKEEPKAEAPKTEAPVEKTEPVNKEHTAEELAFFEDMQLVIMQNNFESVASVELNKESKFYTIFPTDPGFSLELLQMHTGIKDDADWKELVDSTIYMSESTQGLLGNGYSIAILNPENRDNVLLVVTDGIVVYDAFNE